MININTGIYIRVSTEEQANNGYSVRAQEEKLSSFARIKDWNVYDIYIDEGISGKNINERGELLRLINDIKNNNVNNVLVYKIDRLTRSTKDLIDLVELFNQYSCAFNSLSESIDTKTSTGRMFIKIIGIFAEFERENIVERVRLGLERKVKEGFSIANKNISYGYVRKKGERVQEINHNESLIVDKIFNLFLDGNTYSEIARYLNTNSIKTKNGKLWTYKTIKLVLTNPNYIGNVRYGINTNKYFEIKGKHASIISIDKYNKVQEKIKKYRCSDSVFSKKVKCVCGKKMLIKKYYYNTSSNKRIYYRYICNNFNCLIKGISEIRLEREFSLFVSNWNFLTFMEKKSYILNNVKEIIVDGSCVKDIVYFS